MSQLTTLAQRLQQDQALLAPGVYDALTALVAQQLNALVGQGWGREDTSALLKVLEASNGVKA